MKNPHQLSFLNNTSFGSLGSLLSEGLIWPVCRMEKTSTLSLPGFLLHALTRSIYYIGL